MLPCAGNGPLLQCCELCECERAGMPRVFLVSLSIPSSRMEAKQAWTWAGMCWWVPVHGEGWEANCLMEGPWKGLVTEEFGTMRRGWNHEKGLA